MEENPLQTKMNFPPHELTEAEKKDFLTQFDRIMSGSFFGASGAQGKWLLDLVKQFLDEEKDPETKRSKYRFLIEIFEEKIEHFKMHALQESAKELDTFYKNIIKKSPIL